MSSNNKETNNRKDNPVWKKIGTRINSLIGEQDKTQKDLANHLKVKPNVVSYWCKGERTPNTEQIIKIAEFFNVSTDYLLRKTNIQTADTDLKAICLYTGLSEEAVSTLHYYSHVKLPLEVDELYFDIISKILSTDFFYDYVIGNIVTLNETRINFAPSKEEQREAKKLLSDDKIETIHKGGRAIITSDGFVELMIESIKSDFGKIVEKIVNKRFKSHLDKDGKRIKEEK